MCSRRSQVAMLQTNSPVVSALTTLSLRPPLENRTMFGRLETALKKL